MPVPESYGGGACRAAGRYFCASADLKVRDEPRQSIGRTGVEVRESHRLGVRGARRIYDEMEHSEKPIVVAHHAMCVGGGLEMSLSCDFRQANSSLMLGPLMRSAGTA